MNDELNGHDIAGESDVFPEDTEELSGEPWDGDDGGEEGSRYTVLDDWIVFPVIALGVVVASAFPVLLEQQLCLPVLNTLVIFPLFIWAVRGGRARRAVTMTLFWAACLAVTMLVLGVLLSQQASATVQGLAEYRSQFIRWMADGTLVSAAPAQTWLGQARDLVLFVLATALTAGLGGLFLLTLAINIVSVTAASLFGEAIRPLPALLFGWPVWTIARLAGYVLIAVALAEPLAAGLWRPEALAGWFRRRRRLLAYGLIALLAGVLLQVALSPIYRAALESSLGLR